MSRLLPALAQGAPRFAAALLACGLALGSAGASKAAAAASGPKLSPVSEKRLADGAGCQWFNAADAPNGKPRPGARPLAATDFTHFKVGVEGREIVTAFPAADRAWSGADRFTVRAGPWRLAFVRGRVFPNPSAEYEGLNAVFSLVVSDRSDRKVLTRRLIGTCGA